MGLGRGLDALLKQNREAPLASPSRPSMSPPASGGAGTEAGGAGVTELDLAQIRPSALQPRKRFADEALSSLADSIRDHGLLQPVIVRKSGSGYELVAGERRFRAATRLKLGKIPARVINADDEKTLELALIENIQREDLNPIEKAQAFHDLMKTFSLTQEQVAKKVGLERSTVANFLRLLTLPEMIQAKVARGAISMGHARALLSLGDEGKMLAALVTIEREQASVRDAEMIVEETTGAGLARKAPPPSRRGRLARDPVVASYEERLQKALGAKIRIRARKGRGRITIFFPSDAEFVRLMNLLERRFTV